MGLFKKKHLSVFLLAVYILSVCMPVFADVSDGNTVQATLQVECVGKNTDEKFTYLLEDMNEESQKQYETPKSTSMELKNEEKGQFSIDFTYPGTYVFKLSQKKGSDSNTSYDSTVYNVQAVVTCDENGKMIATTVMYKNGSDQKSDKAVFINEKTKPGTNDPGSKDGGKDIKTGDTGYDLYLISLIVGIVGVTLVLIIKKKRRM